MTETLSQDEINQLLAALGEDRGDTQNKEAQPREKTVDPRRFRVYDFKRPDKFSSEHIRSVSLIHETFARLITTTLSSSLRTLVNVDVVSVDQVTYEEFIRSISSPTTLVIIDMYPIKGSAVLEIEPSISFAILEQAYGGAGTPHLVNRELTDIEISTMEGLCVRILADLSQSWAAVLDLRPRLSGTETNPAFAQIVPPSETVVLVTFETKVGEVEGLMNLCIPYLTLEPVIQRLSACHFHAAAAIPGETPAARRSLAASVMVYPYVEFSLDDDSSLREFVALKAGARVECGALRGGTLRFASAPLRAPEHARARGFVSASSITNASESASILAGLEHFLAASVQKNAVFPLSPCSISGFSGLTANDFPLSSFVGKTCMLGFLDQHPASAVLEQDGDRYSLRTTMDLVDDDSITAIARRFAQAELRMQVELGACRLGVKTVLEMAPGKILLLNKLAWEPVAVVLEGQHWADAEVLVADGNFAVRISRIRDGLRSSSRDGDQKIDSSVRAVAILGRARLRLADVFSGGEGTIVTLDRPTSGPVELLIGGRVVAHGDILVIDEEIGFRIGSMVEDTGVEGSDAGMTPATDAAQPHASAQVEPEPSTMPLSPQGQAHGDSLTDPDPDPVALVRTAGLHEALGVGSKSAKTKPFGWIDGANVRHVANFLQNEHPQTIALVLSCLPFDIAATVLRFLPAHTRPGVAARIAVMGSVLVVTLGEIDRVLKRKLARVTSGDYSSAGGLDHVARMLNASDRTTERLVIEGIEYDNPDLAQAIKKRLFVFDDLVMLDDVSIQRVLRDIDHRELARALTGINAEVSEKIIRNLSRRMVRLLRKERRSLGSLLASEVEDSRANLLHFVRSLELEGAIVVSREVEDHFVS